MAWTVKENKIGLKTWSFSPLIPINIWVRETIVEVKERKDGRWNLFWHSSYYYPEFKTSQEVCDTLEQAKEKVRLKWKNKKSI